MIEDEELNNLRELFEGDVFTPSLVVKKFESILQQLEEGAKDSENEVAKMLWTLRNCLAYNAKVCEIEHPERYANLIVSYMLFHILGDIKGGKITDFFGQLRVLAQVYELHAHEQKVSEPII